MQFETQREKFAYTAGLFDGEGTVCMWKTTTSAGNTCYHVTAQVSMTTSKIIDWLHNEFDGNRSIISRKGKRNNTEQDLHVWNLHGENAQKFLMKIFPFLSVKKIHAATVFSFYAREWHESGEPFFLKIKDLNKRGRNKNEKT